MEGPGQESVSSYSDSKSRLTLLLLFCILSFFGNCLTVVLFIRNYSVERQVKELWQEAEKRKAAVNYPAGYQNTASKDNTPENIGEEIQKQGRFFALIGAPGKVHVKRSPDRRGRKGRRGLAPGMTGGDGKNGIQGAKGESEIRIALQGNKDQREVTGLLALKEIPDVMEEKQNQGHRESGEDVELKRDIREKKETPETEKGDSLPVSGSC
ncbi:uncharacterized protein [Montipora capricornis]|uniref:uncharacterized protein isoform X1 n=1 Tax=Montipora capricornis TaxID=246305 RepID=UPI0035F188CC